MFKTNLYMQNTKGAVALKKIRREKSYFFDLMQYPKQTFFAFPQSQYVLNFKTSS